MEVERQTINAIYGYVSSDSGELRKADGAFVFGRADPLVAARAAELYKEQLVDYLLICGGLGKDSGALTSLNLPEAIYQSALLRWKHGVPDKNIFVEPNSTNGGENCRYGMDVILENRLEYRNLILVVHPTSLRRTDAVMRNEASKRGFSAELQRTGTKYSFNANNPVDQKEAIAEMLRIADWPAKGWAAAQDDLPQGLVEYARDLDSYWKNG